MIWSDFLLHLLSLSLTPLCLPCPSVCPLNSPSLFLTQAEPFPLLDMDFSGLILLSHLHQYRLLGKVFPGPPGRHTLVPAGTPTRPNHSAPLSLFSFAQPNNGAQSIYLLIYLHTKVHGTEFCPIVGVSVISVIFLAGRRHSKNT